MQELDDYEINEVITKDKFEDIIGGPLSPSVCAKILRYNGFIWHGSSKNEWQRKAFIPLEEPRTVIKMDSKFLGNALNADGRSFVKREDIYFIAGVHGTVESVNRCMRELGWTWIDYLHGWRKRK